MAVTKYLDYNGLLYLWNLLKTKFNTKVDKSAGMGLSHNDFTDALVQKLNDAYSIANGKQSPETTLAGYGITDAYTKSEVDSKVASAVNYRGSVPTYSALPANPAAGDMYNVTDTDENYIWAAASGNNPARWDPVGALVNIAAITNNEIDAIFE